MVLNAGHIPNLATPRIQHRSELIGEGLCLPFEHQTGVLGGGEIGKLHSMADRAALMYDLKSSHHGC